MSNTEKELKAPVKKHLLEVFATLEGSNAALRTDVVSMAQELLQLRTRPASPLALDLIEAEKNAKSASAKIDAAWKESVEQEAASTFSPLADENKRLTQLFLRVFAQACGEFRDPKQISHSFISAYEEACEWVEEHGLGAMDDTGCTLNEDPFEAALADTVAQAEPIGEREDG